MIDIMFMPALPQQLISAAGDKLLYGKNIGLSSISFTTKYWQVLQIIQDLSV